MHRERNVLFPTRSSVRTVLDFLFLNTMSIPDDLPDRRVSWTDRPGVMTVPPKFRFASFSPRKRVDGRYCISEHARRQRPNPAKGVKPMVAEASIPQVPTKEAHIVDPFAAVCIAGEHFEID